MPGIVVAVSPRAADECLASVCTMTAALRHDHTQASSFVAAPELGVYAGWVQGSESVRKQDASSAGDVTVLIAGEVLGAHGDEVSAARTRSQAAGDLASMYRRQGIDFVANINGLFSGLLIDRAAGRVFLFNDRFGMERLYYVEREQSIYFASEAKALLRMFPEHRAFDDVGVAQTLNYGCTLGARTLFDGISVLEGASVWCFESGGKRTRRRYFDPSAWESQSVLASDEFAALLADRFPVLLAPYLRGDVGLSLTGGFDTRMIAACLHRFTARPICYTFSGLSGETLDEQLAARVAAWDEGAWVREAAVAHAAKQRQRAAA